MNTKAILRVSASKVDCLTVIGAQGSIRERSFATAASRIRFRGPSAGATGKLDLIVAVDVTAAIAQEGPSVRDGVQFAEPVNPVLRWARRKAGAGSAADQKSGAPPAASMSASTR